MTSFARGVWWAGQVQLFIGTSLIVIGPLTWLSVSLMHTRGTSTGAPFALLGWLGTAMAVPFVTSGLMLRGYGAAMDRVTRSIVWQIIELCMVVLLIAVLSIAFVVLLAFLLLNTLVAASPE